MKFFKKIFSKKSKEDGALDFAPLPIPKVRSKVMNMSVGKLKIIEQIGELYQAMPNRRAQVWQVLNEDGCEEFIATVAPGQENQRWVESRLGSENVRIKSWKTTKAEGALRKYGSKFNVLRFDTILQDRYIIRKRLVNDSFVEVYKAWDEQNSNFVYCTIFLPQKNIKVPEEFIQRTFSTDKKHKKYLVNSPEKSILNVLNEGTCKPTGAFFPYRFKIPQIYYVISEYCSDVSFIHFVNTWRRHLPLENMLSVLSQLTHSLLWLKKHGWIHGNIRPEQIWMGTEGEQEGKLYLNGFSLLKEKSDHESTAFQLIKNTAGCGVNSYMSPEQVKYENVGCNCDQFTVGMLLAEFALGKHPFKGMSERKIFNTLKKGVEIKDDTDVPQWLSQVIEKCLSIDPEYRYQDLNEILQEIAIKWKEMELGATGDTSVLFDDEENIARLKSSTPLSIVDEVSDPLAEKKPKKTKSISEKERVTPKVTKTKARVNSTAKPKNNPEEKEFDDFNDAFSEEFDEDEFEELEIAETKTVKKEPEKPKPQNMAFPRPKPKQKPKAKKTKTKTDSNKPRTKVDSTKTKTDSTKSRTKVDSSKPRTKPKTKTDSTKPRTKVDSNKPRTKVDSKKPRTTTHKKIDFAQAKTIADSATKSTTPSKPKTRVDTSSSTKEILSRGHAEDLDQFVNEETAMMEILEKTSSFGINNIVVKTESSDLMRMTATDEFVDDLPTEEDENLFDELEDENFDDWVFEEDEDFDDEDDEDWDVMEASGKDDKKKPD
ncbi:protein kinase [Candidatus Uabimicrobium sp. HlEnr_7]|uniref:protein kinase n=1 Tax=Candidatus Uabimicrobium helgolandensis TaxID=3095367 RepID=UPI003556B170